MKWIGQHIVDLIARFKGDVYMHNLKDSTETTYVVIDSNDKLSKLPRGSRTSSDKHYQYLAFSGYSVANSSGNWEIVNSTGISDHTWTADGGSSGAVVDTSTISIAADYQHAGIRIPYSCTLVGIFGSGRNITANRSYAAGLFVGTPSYGNYSKGSAITATLRASALPNIGTGKSVTYQGPSKIEDLTRSYSINAGDILYPAIRGIGSKTTDTISVSFTVVLKLDVI